jgi:hypothetical protein
MLNKIKGYLTVVVLIILFSTNSYSQNNANLINKRDTLVLEEVKLADSLVLTVLDSAFTFLRDDYFLQEHTYYELKIEKLSDTINSKIINHPYLNIDFYATDRFCDNKYELNKIKDDCPYLFYYKDKQILITYNSRFNNSFVLKFFKPTGNKVNYYNYRKVNKVDIEEYYSVNRVINQNVSFLATKNRIVAFVKYELENFPTH